VLQGPGVSGEHATIIYRESFPDANAEPAYFLRDSSRYGTLVLGSNGWQKIHHQEVLLQSKTQLKFGSSQNPPLEFVVDGLVSAGSA
jgi:FHA domain